MESSVYLRARQEWDELYADLVLGKCNWQIAAAGLDRRPPDPRGRHRLGSALAADRPWSGPNDGNWLLRLQTFLAEELLFCKQKRLWRSLAHKGFRWSVSELCQF